MLHQLSLFLENRRGQIKVPCDVLGRAGIDIITLSLADTQQFGILRLVVKEWERAKKTLEDAGMVVNVTQVVPVEVPDRPGGLAAVLEVLDKGGLPIEYMYAFAAGPRAGTAALVFRFEEPDKAVRLLREAGLRVLEEGELLSRIGQ